MDHLTILRYNYVDTNNGDILMDNSNNLIQEVYRV